MEAKTSKQEKPIASAAKSSTRAAGGRSDGTPSLQSRLAGNYPAEKVANLVNAARAMAGQFVGDTMFAAIGNLHGQASAALDSAASAARGAAANFARGAAPLSGNYAAADHAQARETGAKYARQLLSLMA